MANLSLFVVLSSFVHRGLDIQIIKKKYNTIIYFRSDHVMRPISIDKSKTETHDTMRPNLQTKNRITNSEEKIQY